MVSANLEYNREFGVWYLYLVKTNENGVRQGVVIKFTDLDIGNIATSPIAAKASDGGYLPQQNLVALVNHYTGFRNFKPGNVVRPKSHLPIRPEKMTIRSVQNGKLFCQWFVDSTLHSGYFESEDLELVIE